MGRLRGNLVDLVADAIDGQTHFNSTSVSTVNFLCPHHFCADSDLPETRSRHKDTEQEGNIRRTPALHSLHMPQPSDDRLISSRHRRLKASRWVKCVKCKMRKEFWRKTKSTRLQSACTWRLYWLIKLSSAINYSLRRWWSEREAVRMKDDFGVLQHVGHEMSEIAWWKKAIRGDLLRAIRSWTRRGSFLEVSWPARTSIRKRFLAADQRKPKADRLSSPREASWPNLRASIKLTHRCANHKLISLAPKEPSPAIKALVTRYSS